MPFSVADSKLFLFSSCPLLQLGLGVILMASSAWLVSLSAGASCSVEVTCGSCSLQSHGASSQFYGQQRKLTDMYPCVLKHMCVCVRLERHSSHEPSGEPREAESALHCRGTGNRKPPVLKWVRQDLSEEGRSL